MSQSTVQKTDEAQTLVRALIDVQATDRKLDVVKGKLLWQLKSNNLYKKAFGAGVDTWDEFLRSPEIVLTVSEANRLMQLYDYFVMKFEISEEELEEVPIKTLHHMLPRLKSGEITKEQLPEMIEAAKHLTFNEFKERALDIQHDEQAVRTYTYIIMRKCNETKNLVKIHGIKSEEILTAFPQINEQT